MHQNLYRESNIQGRWSIVEVCREQAQNVAIYIHIYIIIIIIQVAMSDTVDLAGGKQGI